MRARLTDNDIQLSDYDRQALAFKRMADKKFKGQRIKRLLKETVVLAGQLAFCWIIVLAWMWIGLNYFFRKFNAMDHLAGLQYIDWLEMAAVATTILYALFRLFSFAVKE